MTRLIRQDYVRNFLIGFAVAALPLVAFGGILR
jgi:hypothetical protein